MAGGVKNKRIRTQDIDNPPLISTAKVPSILLSDFLFFDMNTKQSQMNAAAMKKNKTNPNILIFSRISWITEKTKPNQTHFLGSWVPWAFGSLGLQFLGPWGLGFLVIYAKQSQS
jgi:hypothetical protein